jgi:hypothetical protein
MPEMSPDQIADERRRGKFAGVAMIVAVALLLGGTFWSSSIDSRYEGKPPIARPNEKPRPDIPRGATAAQRRDAKKKVDDEFSDDRDRVESLATAERTSNELVSIGFIRGLGLLLLLAPAFHLFRAVEARDRKGSRLLGFAAVYGPIGLVVGSLIYTFALRSAASEFAGMSFATFTAAGQEAEDLQEGAGFQVAQVAALTGVIAFIFWLVKANYDAYKLGLFPRSFAILGMGLPLVFFILTPLAFLWLLAVGLLFLGFWPRGLPAAWTEGRAVPWPKREPPLREPAEVGGERNGVVEAVGPGVRKSGEADAGKDEDQWWGGSGEAESEQGDPAGPRRKRKRRR